jgi:hypothetical protein
MTEASAAAQAAAVIAAVDRVLDDAVAAVTQLAATEEPEGEGRLLRASEALLRSHPLLSGMGFAHDPATGPGQVEWFVREAGSTARQTIDTSPAALGHVGYQSFDWFSLPQRTAGPEVVGPYVDFLCGDRYTLTIAVPAPGTGTPRGVFVADLAVADFEHELLPVLLTARTPQILVNAEGRVTVSSAAQVPVGSLLAEARELARSSRFPFRLLAP